MNLVAINLGLAPIPPVPAAAPRRKHEMRDSGHAHRLPPLPHQKSVAPRLANFRDDLGSTLRVLRERGPMSRAHIAALLNMCPDRVSALLYRLRDDGHVEMIRKGPSAEWFAMEEVAT